MPVGELLERISSQELTEWMVFSRVEPIGDAREDLRMAFMASLTANANRDEKKHPAPFGIDEMMPDFWRKPEPVVKEESWKHNLAVAEILTAAMGGQDLRKAANG